MELISRVEAINKNQSWFFTGVPCKNGHIGKIGVKRWNCYQCTRDYKKMQREKNNEAIKKQKRESYRRNFGSIAKKAKEKYPLIKEERSLYLKDYYQKNKEKLLLKQKEYTKENYERISKYKKEWSKTENALFLSRKSKANRRSREKSQGTITKKQLQDLKEKTNKCYWCNKKIESIYHFDHYVPISKGGSNTIENIVVSCSSCNLTKNAKDPIIFANSIGRLL